MAIGSSGSSGFMTSAILRKWGSRMVSAFLSHLAVERKVSASTQNQALAAIRVVGEITHFINGEDRGLG